MWKEIPGYEGLYSVNELGEVKRNLISITNKRGWKFTGKEKILKPYIDRKYHRFALCKNGIVKKYGAHRLVALCFIPNPENKLCVNHKDGNPSNNNISNLEWCTYSENERHSYDILGKKANKTNEKKVNQLTIDNKYIATFVSISEAARSLNIDHRKIIEVLKGRNRRKTAAGFKWEYAK